MTTEAVYVALDASVFEARFRAYPPVADDLEGLAAFLGSEAAAGRWLLAWIAPT